MNKSGLDQINDVDEGSASNSPKSERPKTGAWTSFTKLFRKSQTIKEEKVEESLEKPFDEFSVRELND